MTWLFLNWVFQVPGRARTPYLSLGVCHINLPIKIFFCAALVAVVLLSPFPAAAADHYLIADQFNNRVIEVDHRGNIVWHFGLGPADFSPASIIGVNDAQRVGEFTLMAGTGTPGGQPE